MKYLDLLCRMSCLLLKIVFYLDSLDLESLFFCWPNKIFISSTFSEYILQEFWYFIFYLNNYNVSFFLSDCILLSTY